MRKLIDTCGILYYEHPTYDALLYLEESLNKRIEDYVNVGTIGHVDWSDEIIPICPTGHELMFDRLSDLGYTPVNTKHVKPFYHKGRW